MSTGPSLQERIESTRAGRWILSAAIVGLLAAVVAVNLPASRLREAALGPGAPVLRATGLDQDWAIFAPEPRSRAIALEARVTFADGTAAQWRPPGGGPLVGAYWDYRWRKWVEHVLVDPRGRALWKPAALFIARDVARDGRRPTSVTLTAVGRQLAPPGAPATAEAPVSRETFYRLPLAPVRP
jgi:hypothetical protein